MLRITNIKKNSQIKAEYKIHSTTLAATSTAKYLGVTIDPSLQWNSHLSNIISKANATLAFLRRNIPSCPKHIKSTCFKTFVRPILEYGCCVWDPHQVNHTQELEKIQKRAARFVTGSYDLTHGSTARNLAYLEWPTLAERRAKIKVKILHKARLGLIDIPTSDLIRASATRRSSTDYRPRIGEPQEEQPSFK